MNMDAFFLKVLVGGLFFLHSSLVGFTKQHLPIIYNVYCSTHHLFRRPKVFFPVQVQAEMYSLRPKVHVLNFFTDSEDGSALTVLVNGVRFHIIVDNTELESSRDEYMRLVEAAKREEDIQIDNEGKNKYEEDDEQEKEDDEVEDRLCSCREPEDGRRMIACEANGCRFEWFHFECVGIESPPDGDWICPDCRNVDNQQSNLARHAESTPASDSGVDMDSPKKSLRNAQLDSAKKQPDQRLQDWILQPFGSVFSSLAPGHQAPKEQSLADWYTPQTYFYNLQDQGTKLDAIQLEETDELNDRMKNLIPNLAMPKYITTLDIPWHTASDLIVLEESDALGPLHPSRVQVGDKTHFIKIVDDSQPDATKREIKTLKKIEKLGLHKQFNVPQVLGLVGNGHDDKTIMGFLQTDIPDPTPLTNMLDFDVPQKKRDNWAAESKRIVDLLHDHDLVFGDCKADNFLVDKNDNLWIIDFGGSYTDGWVDPKLAETEEGDDMGIEKIINALHDPDANTFDEDEDQESQPREERKRKRSTASASDRSAKTRKT